MKAKTLMIQGTASSVGKSVLVAAFCRIFKQDGFQVAPFKAQNMALNSYVTRDGGEIGRAQVVQAEAAGIEPTVDMNPILLKPEADARSQVIVQGKVSKCLAAGEYYDHTPYLLSVVRESLMRLCSAYEIVVIEGAGSPAEINLKEREIVNMRVAQMAEAPVLLVGDVDRGGVFASLVGTLELLNEEERKHIKGLIINKFRGELRLLQPGLTFLEERTAKPVLGVIPYFRDISLAQEDSVYLWERRSKGSLQGEDIDIAIICLPHIANYDDFDPLEQDGCRVRYVSRSRELGEPDLIILPGTKSTIADLAYLWREGLAENIIARARKDTPVVGLCGGYQMLGRSIRDPQGVESRIDGALGLGLLDTVTDFRPQKTTSQVKATVVANVGLLAGMEGQEVVGYEIHMGQTIDSAGTPLLQVKEKPEGQVDYADGTIDKKGLIFGTYLHGLFHNASFRDGFLSALRQRRGLPFKKVGDLVTKEEHYDRWAELVRNNLDMAATYKICGLRGRQ